MSNRVYIFSPFQFSFLSWKLDLPNTTPYPHPIGRCFFFHSFCLTVSWSILPARLLFNHTSPAQETFWILTVVMKKPRSRPALFCGMFMCWDRPTRLCQHRSLSPSWPEGQRQMERQLGIKDTLATSRSDYTGTWQLFLLHTHIHTHTHTHTHIHIHTHTYTHTYIHTRIYIDTVYTHTQMQCVYLSICWCCC